MQARSMNPWGATIHLVSLFQRLSLEILHRDLIFKNTITGSTLRLSSLSLSGFRYRFKESFFFAGFQFFLIFPLHVNQRVSQMSFGNDNHRSQRWWPAVRGGDGWTWSRRRVSNNGNVLFQWRREQRRTWRTQPGSLAGAKKHSSFSLGGCTLSGMFWPVHKSIWVNRWFWGLFCSRWPAGHSPSWG